MTAVIGNPEPVVAVGKKPIPAEENEDAPASGGGRLARLRAALRGAFSRPVPAAEDGEDAPAAAPPRRRLVQLAGYAAVLLAGASIGGAGAYALLAGALSEQSAEIGRQQEALAQQNALLAGYERILVLDHRQLEAEQARLATQEKAFDADARKLEERKARLAETERRLAQLRQERAAPAPAAGAKAADGAPRSGNCDLRGGNIGAALKSCIDEFNGK